MIASRIWFLALVVCPLLSPVELFSQAGVASLSGLVTDPSGAIVVGAQITETDIDTQIARTTVTDHSGYYTFVGLPVGHYRVSAAQPGFDTKETSLMLDPSDQARQDFHLLVAGATSQVSVTIAAPQLSRDDASIGTVIDNQTIVGTPLYQRNWDDLIRLIPGVQMQRFTEESGSSVSAVPDSSSSTASAMSRTITSSTGSTTTHSLRIYRNFPLPLRAHPSMSSASSSSSAMPTPRSMVAARARRSM